MSNSKSLTLRDGTVVHALDKNHEYFLQKMCLIYGGSGTGKSTILDEIMWLLKSHIPVCFVISPTNSCNDAFTGKIPKKCIKDGRDLKKLVQWLDAFILRQKNATQLYQNANNIKNLKFLFDKIVDSRSQNIEMSIKTKAQQTLSYLERNKSSLNSNELKVQKQKIKKEQDRILCKLYKNIIRTNKVKLESLNLPKKERAALTFLDINPHALLVLDDCASKFKKLYRMTTSIKEIFYEGRQSCITTIITAQDDKEIDSELRKNSMVNIFTTSQIATAAFERSSNSYPKNIREHAKLCIEKIFLQDTPEKHFRKFVFIQNATDQFKYLIADLYEDYKMGCDSIWEFEKKMGVNSINNLLNNPFFNKYG